MRKGLLIRNLVLWEVFLFLSLIHISFDEINEKAGILIAEGIKNLRNNNVETIPGYDGEYGKVNVISQKDRDRIFGQIKLFDDESSITVKNKNSDVKKILHTIKEERTTETNEENYGLNEEPVSYTHLCRC